MPFLIADAERFMLRAGRNVLGGRGADAVPLTALTGLPPAAEITVAPDGGATIRRLTAGVVVAIDGEALGSAPHVLAHGARLAVGPCRIMYAAPTAERGRTSEDPTEIAPVVPTSDGTGRLIEVRTGRVFRIPAVGLVFGRGGSANVPVDGKGVSRRHAVVRPDGPGFVVSDESANGTFVNGERVVGTRTLAQGDVLRIEREEFRLEVDSALPPMTADAPSATELVAGVSGASRATAAPRRAATRAGSPSPAPPPSAAAPPLALLEVVDGALAGTVFRLERPVCSIGRGPRNDVQLSDDSVSASHATVLLKRGSWYVVDLQSANGTYVDGYRVVAERSLPNSGTLRVGNVTMRLRALTGAPKPADPTQAAAGGFWRRLAKRWTM